MGHRGDSFLKIYILGIFGGISSNFSLDRCQKPPKKFFLQFSWLIFQWETKEGKKKSFDRKIYSRRLFLQYFIIQQQKNFRQYISQIYRKT